MQPIIHLPRDDSTNGWSRILASRDPHPPLNEDTKADWVVVGGGFAGLAAARRLAENRPQDKIALVDASIAGENTSGRNSGFAIDLPHNTFRPHNNAKCLAIILVKNTSQQKNINMAVGYSADFYNSANSIGRIYKDIFLDVEDGSFITFALLIAPNFEGILYIRDS